LCIKLGFDPLAHFAVRAFLHSKPVEESLTRFAVHVRLASASASRFTNFLLRLAFDQFLQEFALLLLRFLLLLIQLLQELLYLLFLFLLRAALFPTFSCFFANDCLDRLYPSVTLLRIRISSSLRKLLQNLLEPLLALLFLLARFLNLFDHFLQALHALSFLLRLFLHLLVRFLDFFQKLLFNFRALSFLLIFLDLLFELFLHFLQVFLLPLRTALFLQAFFQSLFQFRHGLLRFLARLLRLF